ncbi:hypothetical protein RI030_16625 [Aphanizomenon flos-aquae NRERC-008]|jgi:hypothetical protein|uniref:Uncharacterized protein n=1 Tax=Aphanizomenon flos-aquae FACHB-1249 TaxID=2692889 RepID=A0ABR8ITT0_APHFL|nr:MULTISPECIES: hypothetical protein [Aphanizomenon]QSV66239.1 MAG: hypothetical protein HEQ12_04255 [Aphanizomenon flos-aquae DEX188]MBD2392044.1 hypothetical protein [Aphanizomenon flos-aquae FACHB-1171]MBD2557907.1 hypothetical protein [Aphanizomenon flos-aquae FACHB-1290]MBD2630217.1 hypothetical protein [Aphanizomenon sp. FACHB-1399]MBD2641268.1 hypothetical protein [Aphanizomenon sp. FACHB-1401]
MVTKFDHNLVMSENVEFVIVSCQWSVVGCQWSVVNGQLQKNISLPCSLFPK